MSSKERRKELAEERRVEEERAETIRFERAAERAEKVRVLRQLLKRLAAAIREDTLTDNRGRVDAAAEELAEYLYDKLESSP